MLFITIVQVLKIRNIIDWLLECIDRLTLEPHHRAEAKSHGSGFAIFQSLGGGGVKSGRTRMLKFRGRLIIHS